MFDVGMTQTMLGIAPCGKTKREVSALVVQAAYVT